MDLNFRWDPQKAAANYTKHKVSFEEALTVFNDQLAFIFEDEEHSEMERRETIIGHSNKNRLLIVAFTEHTANMIRIFSARLVTKRERNDYEDQRIR